MLTGRNVLRGLWRHPDFLKLWAGQTISRFGSEISQLAIPLTAALVLSASPFQMGVLSAVEFAPFLLLSLLAGVWVDRLPRRPLLVISDLGRALVLASIPLAAIFGMLRMEQLFVVGLLTGALTVVFDVAYQAYLPALVSRDALVEGNSKLAVSASVAQIAGPGLGGALVQLITAPVAVILDAVSFAVSAACLLLIRTREQIAPRSASGTGVWTELRQGLAVVIDNPVLRSIAGCTATSNLFGSASQAIYVLYLTRELEIEPALLGIILAMLGPGALVGSLVAGPAALRLGLGTTIVGSIVLGVAANLLVPLAAGPRPLVVVLLCLASFLVGLTSPIYNVNQVSLRQAITPDHLQGRMNASMRFIVWGTIPLGSLLGGSLGQVLGLRPTLLVMAVLGLLAPLWVAFSPVRRLPRNAASAGRVYS
jgi:MFS family permease